MKKYLLIFLVTLISGITLPAQASVLKAKAVETISTTSPKEHISIKLSRNFTLNKQIELKKGYILTGKMIDIKDPTSWHHNATFTFIPTSYKDTNGEEHDIKTEIKATIDYQKD